MFDEKLHRRAAANIDFRRGENVGKHQKDSSYIFFKKHAANIEWPLAF